MILWDCSKDAGHCNRGKISASWQLCFLTPVMNNLVGSLTSSGDTSSTRGRSRGSADVPVCCMCWSTAGTAKELPPGLLDVWNEHEPAVNYVSQCTQPLRGTLQWGTQLALSHVSPAYVLVCIFLFFGRRQICIDLTESGSSTGISRFSMTFFCGGKPTIVISSPELPWFISPFLQLRLPSENLPLQMFQLSHMTYITLSQSYMYKQQHGCYLGPQMLVPVVCVCSSKSTLEAWSQYHHFPTKRGSVSP